MTPNLAHTLDSLANEFQYDASGRWGVETVGPIREAARIIAALAQQPAASGEPVATVRRAHAGGRVRSIGHQVCDLLPGANVQDGAMLYAAPQPAPARVPLPMTWYDGAPPFPQDQEWFIAETIHGDRVVLRSLDEGWEHKHTYDFKTADGTYMATRIIKRWMQFPDCEYLPPAAAPTAQQEPARAEGE